MYKLPLVLSPINLLLIVGLCYYAWTQKNNFDRAYSKIEVVADDVVKLRLESESQSKRFASDVVNQEAGLQKLKQSQRDQFEEMEAGTRALNTKIQGLSRLADGMEELKQHASQLKRLEARIKMIEMEKNPTSEIELLQSRCDELEGAIAALLSNALLN
jgi:polyhydroxyalkanoate synthesis regulator phasin